MMISVIIPIFNEKEVLDELFERVSSVLSEITGDYEIIFVDDGSWDGSLEKLIGFHNDDQRVKIISLSKNFGHPAAITAGLEHAKGEFIAMMDGDLQDPPELIRDMYGKLSSGEIDVINGRRKSRKEKQKKRLVIYLFHRLFVKLSGLKEIENSGNFSMLNRSALDAMLAMKEKTRYLPGLRSFIGFRHDFVDYIREDRKAGKSKMGLKKLLGLGSDAIFSFSRVPLKICLILGLIGVAVFMLAGIYVIFAKIFGLAPLGWSSTLLSIYFLGSIQLTFMGVIGEYIFRIYKESQDRPLYIIRKIYH
ncbi:MAG: glycosyltransferase family 2 protein [Bacteroidales bacterium]|nr:MAG: glycosyltransferase family 2 protein [Bacteroidales bacterium]